VRRPLLSSALRGGLQLAVQIALALALFAVLQILATRHNVRFDLTPAQRFALSPTARQVAAAVEQPVRVTVFYNSQSGDARRDMADLLEQFRNAAPTFSYRLLDLDRSPALATKYGVSSYNTGVLEVDGQVAPLRSVDEAEITSLLLSLSGRAERGVCFVTGHGERSPQDTDERHGYSEMAKALEQERFTIRALSTLPSDGVPEACTLVVMPGPSHDLLPGEAEALLRYLRGGGRALVLVDPDAPASVLALLGDVGIDARRELIVDAQNRFIGADSFMPRVVGFRPDVFRNSLSAAAVLSLARPLGATGDPPPGVRVMPIAQTAEDTWAMADTVTAPEGEPRFRREVDEVGPFTVGVLASFDRGDGEAPGQLMVFGDSDFSSNFYLNLLGNRDLILSAIAVLAEDPTLIAMRNKGAPSGTLSPISLTEAQITRIRWAGVFAGPLICLLLAAIIGLRRARRRGGR
jgi:hypothetical protein